jgi:hypothetical protein
MLQTGLLRYLLRTAAITSPKCLPNTAGAEGLLLWHRCNLRGGRSCGSLRARGARFGREDNIDDKAPMCGTALMAAATKGGRRNLLPARSPNPSSDSPIHDGKPPGQRGVEAQRWRAESSEHVAGEVFAIPGVLAPLCCGRYIVGPAAMLPSAKCKINSGDAE